MAAVLAEKRYYAPKCVAPKRVYRGSRLFDWRVLTAGLRAVCVECQCPASRFCGVGLVRSLLLIHFTPAGCFYADASIAQYLCGCNEVQRAPSTQTRCCYCPSRRHNEERCERLRDSPCLRQC